MAMILPKGILENTREIYAEVASYDIVPPEKICQYWNVYTTTFRRLIDPIAYRLENFWWHVWGSDLRYLSGPKLAKLFEEFATGPTFVPLKSPANRYEGPPIPRAVRRELDRSDSEPGQSSTAGEDDKDDPAKPTLKYPTPSSSRPPPPHPILKKSRGPSTSGPRPTARFVSPAGSDDEGKRFNEASGTSTLASSGTPSPQPSANIAKVLPTAQARTPAPAMFSAAAMPPPPLPIQAKQDNAIPSSNTQTAAPVPMPAPVMTTIAEMPPPPLPTKANTEQTAPLSTPQASAIANVAEMIPPSLSPVGKRGKRVSAATTSTTTGARTEMRPPSAPSSGKSGAPARKVVATTAAFRRRPVIPRRASSQSSAGSDAGSREVISTMAAVRQRSVMNPSGPGRSSSQESAASSSSQTSQSSGLTMKTLAKRPVKSPSSKRPAARAIPVQAESQLDQVAVEQQGAGIPPQRRSTWDGREVTVTQEPAPNRVRAPPVAGFVADQMPSLGRSRSNAEAPHTLGAVRLRHQALAATTVVATSTTMAKGLFNSETKPTPTVPDNNNLPGTTVLPSRPSASALLDLQFTPTPPNPAPPIPFGRTVSQLTLLLEREKARDEKGR